MKILMILMFAFVLTFPVASYAQADTEKEAVRQAVLDYVEGVYEVAPERIERSVHPELVKRGFYISRDVLKPFIH